MCFFFTSDLYKNYNYGIVKKVCDALVYILDNISIRFGTKLYRQTIGIRSELIVLLLLQICFFLLWKRFHEVSLKGKSG